MKRGLLFCVVFMIIFSCGIIYKKSHIKFDFPDKSKADIYLFVDSIIPSEKVKLTQEDYNTLWEILEEIKYQNFSIDLMSEEYVIYGFTNYAVRFESNETYKEFAISNCEVSPGVRVIYYSDSFFPIAGYVPDKLYHRYLDLFRKYNLTTE